MKNSVKLKKPNSQPSRNQKRIQRYLIAYPLFALLIKLVVMLNTPNGGWYGADGENYMLGVDGLVNEGFFSTQGKLSYWPAGYPLLIWPLAEISLTKVFYLLSSIQSLLFAFATYFFTNQIAKSKIAYLATFTSLLISFNPTLSLNSLSVGYETPISACLMMAIGIIIKHRNSEESKISLAVVGFASSWFALAIFMQPRFILVGFAVIILWVMKFNSRRSAALLLLISTTVMVSTPTIMIYRNLVVIDQATISTNLGVTMAIGAGDQTKGGYLRTGPEVPCNPIPPETSVTDNRKVRCVLEWYVANPIKTLKLAFNKSQYFWSPWSGPLADGTMLRNPWLKIAPTKQIATEEDGYKLVYGSFGKLVSYIWIISQLLLLFVGYQELNRRGEVEKFFSKLFVIPIVITWIISIGTIGDHRFRMPTMIMSLLLQAAGLISIKKKFSKVF
jgi:hypothetical protein